MPTKPKKSGRGEVDAFQKPNGGQGNARCWGGGTNSLLKDFSIAVSSTKALTPHSYRPRNSLMSQPLCNLFSFLSLHFLFLLTLSLSYPSHPCSFVAIVFSKFLVYCGVFQEINEHSSLFYIKVICIFFYICSSTNCLWCKRKGQDNIHFMEQ